MKKSIFILLLLVVFSVSCEGERGLTGLSGKDGDNAVISEYNGTLKATIWNNSYSRWEISINTIKDTFSLNVYAGYSNVAYFSGFEPSIWYYSYDKYKNLMIIYIFPQTEPFIIESGNDYHIIITY